MLRTLAIVAATLLFSVSVSSQSADQRMFRSALHDYRVTTVVPELVQPWSIAFLPTLNGPRVVAEEALLQGLGRVRDVRQGPDGFIYIVTDDREGRPTPVVRLEPIERTPVG
jgi:hypothetical protein